MILDAEGAIRSLRTVVFEKGRDFVYLKPPGETLCLNFHDDKPGCIAGHVYALLGLTADRAREIGSHGNTSVSEDVRNFGVYTFEWGINEDAVQILTAAQVVQDSGGTWGEALDKAEGIFANRL